MKKSTSVVSAIAMSAVFLLIGCQSDDAKPVTQFNASINGQSFTPKVLVGQFFTQDQLIYIEGHQLDSTYTNQYVMGLEVEYSTLNKPTEYDFAEHDMIDDVIFYFFNNDGKSYSPKEGKLIIKKVSDKHFEATFSSLVLKSGYVDAPAITLTDGTIRIDLVATND